MILRIVFMALKISIISKLNLKKRIKDLFEEKLLIAIFITALFIRAIGLVPNLGGHPDESAIYGPALKMATDFSPIPSSYVYGTLYIYLQGIVSFLIRAILIMYSLIMQIVTAHSIDIFGLLDQYSYKSIMQGNTPYFDIYIFFGRFLTAVMGALTVIPTFKLGKILFNKSVGFVAATILAFSGLFVRDSQYITIEVPWAFFTTIAVLFCSYLLLKQDKKNAILAGFFVGLSTSMKYLPIALPALVMAIMFSFQKNKLKKWIQNSFFSLMMIPVGFVAGSPFLPFNFSQFTKEISWFFNFYGHESWWKEGSGFQPHLLTGQFKSHQIGFLYQYGLGEIASFFAIVGLLYAFFKSPKKTCVLLASPAFIISFFVLATSTLYTRQIVPSVPFLCIFAAVGIFWFGRYKNITLIIITLIAIFPLAIKTLPSSFYCGKEKSIKKARAWLSQDPAPIPLESRVAVSYNISMPSRMKYDVIEMKSEEDFTLKKLREKHREYVLLYDEAVYSFLYWTNNYFTAPRDRIKNTSIIRSVNELKTEGKVMASFTKPIDYELCPDYSVYVIKI